MNALDNAPSANRSRVRLGMRNPRLKASLIRPAPNRRAITVSRSSPVTRLISTASETTPAERTSRSVRFESEFVSSLSVLFKEVGNGHDPGVIVGYLVFLVGRM